MKYLLCLVLAILLCEYVLGTFHGTSQADWENYKTTFNKVYTNPALPESYAQYYYNYNKKMINSHNARTTANRATFTLAENQFTDIRLIHFNALFPTAIQPSQSFNVTPMAVQDAPTTYDPFTSLGLTSVVQDQGTACNSGWAYASAKSIELMQAFQTGNMAPDALSAQNLLDCAGTGTGCTTQSPQTAFDYLTQYGQDLHVETDYPNNTTNKVQGMCVPQEGAAAVVTRLASYARIRDGDDAALMKNVAAGYPVVVEYNPTSFEFMHYSSGVFQQPTSVKTGSHFMTVVGYGNDAASGLDYWLLENSFGTTWGELGYIKIARNTNTPLAKNAIFPYELS